MIKIILVTVALLGLILPGTVCIQQGTTPPPPVTVYTVTGLKYLLIKDFGTPFFVDTDFYPVAREGVEEKNALAQFPAIKAGVEEYTAILDHLVMLDKDDLTTEEKLAVYREHKKLTHGIALLPSGDAYNFSLRITEGQGEHIAGVITKSGKISVTKREPSFNTYPICLTGGTRIATPEGEIPVERLRPGMVVWTADAAGQRVPAVVEKTSFTPVADGIPVLKLTLHDGRSVTASPGHPSVDRALGDYRPGDLLDGAVVISVAMVDYYGGATFDLLPSGPTGTYWANGIPLKSTLVIN